MENTLIVALHGFLGLPSDWNQWHLKFGENKAIWPINLWSSPNLNSDISFSKWTENFLVEILKLKKTYTNIDLWGYSMGGRLALSALTQAPELFTNSKILSANPGIEQIDQRENRRLHDENWAKRFETDSWSQLIHDWNHQSVFFSDKKNSTLLTSTQPHRIEKEFNRSKLASAFRNWSIAVQPNFWPQIQDLTENIEWHVGSLDSIYLEYGNRIKKLNPKIQLVIHNNLGHRLL